MHTAASRPHLLSPAAQRLLALLTPEPVELSCREASSAPMAELARLGLIKIEWGSECCLIYLSPEGRRWSMRVN